MKLGIICGLTFISLFFLSYFKQTKNTIAFPLTVLFTTVLTGQVLNTLFTDFYLSQYFKDMEKHSAEINILLKVFGISLTIETVSDICRDQGETSIASKVELAGKAEILILCIPLIQRVLEIIKGLMI